MGKITIKHYLHKGAAAQDDDYGKYQPVYVQVIVKRQVNRMRSQAYRLAGLQETDLILTKKDFEKVEKNLNSPTGKALQLEKKLIEDLINFGKPFERENFTIKSFALIYEVATQSIRDAFNTEGNGILFDLLHGEWRPVFLMLDFNKLFHENIEGLTLLGSDNLKFKKSVLDDKYLKAAIIIDQYFWEFAKVEFGDPDGNFDYLRITNFYWFQEEHSIKFIHYLKQKKYIKSDQEEVIKDIIDLVHTAKIGYIKMLNAV